MRFWSLRLPASSAQWTKISGPKASRTSLKAIAPDDPDPDDARSSGK
jgi:hypothetical protein